MGEMEGTSDGADDDVDMPFLIELEPDVAMDLTDDSVRPRTGE